MFKKLLISANIVAHTYAVGSVYDECMREIKIYCQRAEAAWDPKALRWCGE